MTLEERIEKLERIVAEIRPKKKKWTKVSTVKKLTGWDRRRLQQARNNGEIEWKKKNGYWYDLSSIHPLLLKD